MRNALSNNRAAAVLQPSRLLIEEWGRFDERELEARRRANRNRTIASILLAAVTFCGAISAMLGVPQSYLAQMLVTLPKYPGAQLLSFRNGLDCPPTMGVYCYKSTYRTADSPEQVIAYYERMNRLAILPAPRFVAERDRRYFGNYQIANLCGGFLGHRSCTEITVVARPEGTEVNYLEIGYPGDSVPVDDSQ